jgi:hypothetical protein
MTLAIVALSGITDAGLADGSTSAAPKPLVVSPAIGGLTTIVHFRYVALGNDEGGVRGRSGHSERARRDTMRRHPRDR